jgi:hypothetical protein
MKIEKRFAANLEVMVEQSVIDSGILHTLPEWQPPYNQALSVIRITISIDFFHPISYIFEKGLN